MENLKLKNKNFEYLIVIRNIDIWEQFKNIEDLIEIFEKNKISDLRLGKDFILKAYNGKIKDLKLKEYLNNSEPLLCISSPINKLNFLYTVITYSYNYYNCMNDDIKSKELVLYMNNLYKLCNILHIKHPKNIKILEEKEMNRLFSTDIITFDPIKYINSALLSFILNDRSFVLISKSNMSLFPLEPIFNSFDNKIGYYCKLLGGIS